MSLTRLVAGRIPLLRLRLNRLCQGRVSVLPWSPMNIVQITPGAGRMFCGGCLHDNALVTALRKLGHDTLMLPLYLPPTLDEPDQSAGLPVFYGGISVYLEQKFPLLRHMPGWFRHLLAKR